MIGKWSKIFSILLWLVNIWIINVDHRCLVLRNCVEDFQGEDEIHMEWNYIKKTFLFYDNNIDQS